jgi:hypothetical protein
VDTVKPGRTQKRFKYEVRDKGLGDPQFPPQTELGRRRFRFFRCFVLASRFSPARSLS